jgi:SAM-dependent methyltransferase
VPDHEIPYITVALLAGQTEPIMQTKNPSEGGNVWKLENIATTYWDDYIATRPKYDLTIFKPIFDYHSEGSASFEAALDIGTGAGSALEQLTNRFELVSASDNDPRSIEYARSRFRQTPRHRLQYLLSSGEDLLLHYQPGAFDLVTCAETFPLLDTEQTLDGIHKLLRPNGTLAIWFYGVPFFTEPAIAAKCQHILYELVDRNFTPVVSGRDKAGRESWKRAADGMTSWLDYIPFAPGLWQDVYRYKWNTQARLPFFGPNACDFEVEPMSSTHEGEKIIEEQNPDFWAVEWDFEMLKRFVAATFPKPADMVGIDESMEKLFSHLKVAMGGDNIKRHLSWPVVLVLARKRA